jgi:hypothetical protein
MPETTLQESRVNHLPDNPIPTDVQGFLMLRGLILPLPHDHDFVLGRDKGLCNVVLAHEHISKQHTVISYFGGRFFIKDLGSLNGTIVNGKRITSKVPLVAGDEIRLPPYMMLFFGPETPATEAPPPRTGLKSEPGRKKGSISGLLSILSVTDLIQILNFTAQSGKLVINTPQLETGELAFVQGEIIQARFAGKSGEEAVYAILRAGRGEFEFIQGSPEAPPDAISRKTLSLLLEGSRLMDESKLSTEVNLS